MVICKREAFPDEMDAVLDMTKLLLKKGAVVNIRDRTGYAHMTRSYSSQYIFKYFISLQVYSVHVCMHLWQQRNRADAFRFIRNRNRCC